MIAIGTAGWSIPRALGERFPGPGPHLARYARVLTCAEINSSFHRPHRPEVYAKWAALTPPGFRFAVKMPRAITHEARLRGARALLDAFLAETASLGMKRGPLLAQLPPSLAFEARHAGAFFRLLRARHTGPVVCEPRHASWFEAKAEGLLARHGIGRAAADPAVVPQAAQPGGYLGPRGDGARAVVYYRLHGAPRKYRDRYPVERVRQWAQSLRLWPGGAEVWCIFDNTASDGAMANVLEMDDALSAPAGRASCGPHDDSLS